MEDREPYITGGKMREIKFRAWDKRNNCFYTKTPIAVNGDGVIRLDVDNGTWRDTSLIPQLFTGLKDKNGKEIWESDIIQDDHYYRPEVVEWVKGGFWLREDDGTLHMPTIMTREIIGNIYENPELLNNKVDKGDK